MTKDGFRKNCLNKLKKISKINRIKKNKTICLNILKLLEKHKAKKVLLYVPLGMEADIRPVIDILRKKSKMEVYVPYMKGKSFIPVKYRLPLKKKRFGIKEPLFSNFKKGNIELDFIVVPVVGVDRSFKRVGFGAGMYDRFFANLKKRPITVFTQLSLCYTNSLVTNHYDISPDYIITAK